MNAMFSAKVAASFMFGALVLTLMPASFNVARAAENTEYKEIYDARLTGMQEVPAVTTDAYARMHLKVREDEGAIRYHLMINEADNVTDAHLHCGAMGQNGPAVVDLYTPTKATDLDDHEMTGRVMQRDIMENLRACDPGIRTLSHLIQALREGKVYVNIHSTDHPNGLIRGQFMPVYDDLMTMPTDDDMNDDNPNSDTDEDMDDVDEGDDGADDDMNGVGGGSGEDLEDNDTDEDMTNGDDDEDTDDEVVGPGPNGAHLLLSSYFVMPPDEFTIHGHRFAANESVRVTALGHTYTVKANAQGSFSVADIAVALNQADTLFPIQATGLTSGITQNTMLKVGTYYPVVTPNSWFMDGGEEVRFNGRHFGPSEDIQLSVDGVNMLTFESDAFGGIAHDFHVPTEPGVHTIGFTGVDSGAHYELDLRVY